MLGIGRRRSHRELARKELNESLDHFMQAATHIAGGMGAAVGPRVTAARGYVTPTAGRMRNAASQGWGSTVVAMAPLASAAKDGARSAGNMARRAKSRNKREAEVGRRRWSMLAGLLAAGAAVGAAGAMVLRRRKQWEEYDPTRTLEAMHENADSAIDSARDTVNRTAESGASAAGRSMDSAKAATGRASDRVGGTADRVAAKADDAAAEAAATFDAAKDKTASMTESAKEKTSSAAEGAKRRADEATDFLGKTTPSRNSRG